MTHHSVSFLHGVLIQPAQTPTLPRKPFSTLENEINDLRKTHEYKMCDIEDWFLPEVQRETRSAESFLKRFH